MFVNDVCKIRNIIVDIHVVILLPNLCCYPCLCFHLPFMLCFYLFVSVFSAGC